MAMIRGQPFDVWQAAVQRSCAEMIAHLPGSDDQIQQISSEGVTPSEGHFAWPKLGT
ncbi:hypothetical protein PVT71_27535 (plasmid) [Salipiger sp. H15]|uniref:Uncharacterized protein n=1 Tax=Alloyangia sp. H15 TaxID=3029062 RepID=A0AAU8AUC5_9RHOB